jgi:hypothetical protein
MRGLLAVARREIAQRWQLFVAAAFAAVISFLVPLVHGFHGMDASEARSAFALGLSVVFLLGVSAYLGGTGLPQAMADRRIGFDFARPLPGWAIWGGTLCGTLVLSFGTAAIASAPLALTGDAIAWSNLSHGTEIPLPPAITAVAASLLAFGLFGAVGTAIRARSPLLLADILLVPAAIAGAGYALIKLTWAGADKDTTIRAMVALFLVEVLGLLAAGLAAVAIGRTDIRVAHRAQLAVLIAALGIGIVYLYGYGWWLSSAGPSELMQISRATAAARSPWTFVEGKARGATAGFLYDTEDGRFMRVPWGVGEPAFSENSLVAGWIQRLGDTARLRVANLGEKSPSAKTRVTLSGDATDLTLDANGSRAAVLEKDRISVFDIATSRLLASARIDGSPRSVRLFFAGGGLLRVYVISEPDKGRVDILELDVPGRRLARTGVITGVVGWPLLATDATGRTLACVEFEPKRLRLFEARTGRPIATVSQGDTFSGGFRFLSDGRFLAIARRGQDRVFEVVSPEGAIVRELPFPGPPIAPAQPRYTAIGGEALPGVVIVATGPSGGEILYAIPLDGERERKLGEHLRPVSRYVGFFGRPNEASPPGAPASTLFQNYDGSLVRLDPATGQQTVILGKGAH